jgi:hypothetical protein
MRLGLLVAPAKNLAMPSHPWATAKFRSIASARSHWPMPWSARLLYIRNTPIAQWAFALSGLSLSALRKSASAEPNRRRSSEK